jgi:hypothetical protein
MEGAINVNHESTKEENTFRGDTAKRILDRLNAGQGEFI